MNALLVASLLSLISSTTTTTDTTTTATNHQMSKRLQRSSASNSNSSHANPKVGATSQQQLLLQQNAPPPASALKGCTLPASMDDRLSCHRRAAPIVFDCFLHHNLQWGSLTLAWGPLQIDNRTVVTDASRYTLAFRHSINLHRFFFFESYSSRGSRATPRKAEKRN